MDARLPLPGPAEPYRDDLDLEVGRLLSEKQDPAKVVRWLVTNPDAGDEEELMYTLELALQEATTWQAAAQAAMETFYCRLAAENDYYR